MLSEFAKGFWFSEVVTKAFFIVLTSWEYLLGISPVPLSHNMWTTRLCNASRVHEQGLRYHCSLSGSVAGAALLQPHSLDSLRHRPACLLLTLRPLFTVIKLLIPGQAIKPPHHHRRRKRTMHPHPRPWVPSGNTSIICVFFQITLLFLQFLYFFSMKKQHRKEQVPNNAFYWGTREFLFLILFIMYCLNILPSLIPMHSHFRI